MWAICHEVVLIKLPPRNHGSRLTKKGPAALPLALLETAEYPGLLNLGRRIVFFLQGCNCIVDIELFFVHFAGREIDVAALSEINIYFRYAR